MVTSLGSKISQGRNSLVIAKSSNSCPFAKSISTRTLISSVVQTPKIKVKYSKIKQNKFKMEDIYRVKYFRPLLKTPIHDEIDFDKSNEESR